MMNNHREKIAPGKLGGGRRSGKGGIEIKKKDFDGKVKAG
jgi:hypothetical protein